MRINIRVGKELVGITMVLTTVIGFGVVKSSSRPAVSVNKGLISNSLSSSNLKVKSALSTSKLPDRAKAQVQEAYGNLPLSFELNDGQVDRQVKFLSRGRGYGVFLTSTEIALQLPISDDGQRTGEPVLLNSNSRFLIKRPSSSNGKHSDVSHRATKLSMKLLGANSSPRILGLDELPGKSNYLIGQDPMKWRTNIATYPKVKYQSVYPGINLIYYGNQRQLEYDFVIEPGADPRAIRFTIEGAEKLEIDSDGELVMDSPAGKVHQHKPVVYREEGNGPREIAGNYILRNNGELAFQVSDYDRSRSLVIDPVLAYSTYLGGTGYDEHRAIAVDAKGNAYITGITESNDFPTAHPLDSPNGGWANAFVAKLNPSGTALLYCTYLGGNGGEVGTGIAVDASGHAYLTGMTDSTNFPTDNPLQPASGGSFDGFVAKLNTTGSALVYSTYLGGSEEDDIFGIAVDPYGNAYVTGKTESINFPTAYPLQATFRNGYFDCFVTKVNPTGSALIYSTYLGGSGEDVAEAIAVDVAGNAYIIRWSSSVDFPMVNALQPAINGNQDAFVVKVNSTGTALVYSSYLGGSDLDYGDSITLGSSGNVYVTGTTFSAKFPTTGGSLQPDFSGTEDPSLGGSADVFVTMISENPEPDNITLFVPIVLSSAGVNNSFFTSEMALTNRGASDAALTFTYTAAFGEGSGSASDLLLGGQQRIIPDAISYLKSIGIPIPDAGNRGGTLMIKFAGLSSPSDASVTVRTTSAVATGRAGLAYSGIPTSAALKGPSYLCGLRQSGSDRSNVAIQNVGTPAQGDITLRLTIFSGDPSAPLTKVLPDETLPPGGFKQFSGILNSNGLSLTNGYVRVERMSGSAPYYAYAVINDQSNSDGSFIPPLRETELAGQTSLTLPVIVETSAFSSEVVLTNFSGSSKAFHLYFTPEGVATGSAIEIIILSGEQRIIPNFVQFLRDHGSTAIGPVGSAYVGVLSATVDGGAKGAFMGARTSTPGGGGRYGLFYVAGSSSGWAVSTWLNGLQQNSESRTNLALVNTDSGNGSTNTFRIELFDGNTGQKVNVVEGIALKAGHWLQIGTILSKYAPGVTQGYAKVTRAKGSNPFIAYAVINDGSQAGERSGDGAFILSSP